MGKELRRKSIYQWVSYEQLSRNVRNQDVRAERNAYYISLLRFPIQRSDFAGGDTKDRDCTAP
jgi:hypothetical protein